MPKKTKILAKRRLDKFYRLAKDEGFKSRAAFKLLQINREYQFLGNCRCLIDLCAAPGGWTQVAAKHMPLSSLIVAVDLVKMKPIAGAKIITGDITSHATKSDIKKTLGGWQADAILHDGAPNVTGTWSKDAYGQCELTLSALRISTEFLRRGGWFITKIFRSADYNTLLWVFQQFFENVVPFKPIASRQSSAEIYFICQNYLAPIKIDSRLLDPKFVFREIEEKKQSISVMKLRKKKHPKPSREGYEQVGLLLKSTSVIDLLKSESPEAILGEYHSFQFDDTPECKLCLSNANTTEEIKTLLSDLKVLGKSDFRRLLRWRSKMNKYIQSIKEQKEEKEKKPDDNNETVVKTSEEIEKEEDMKMETEVRDMMDKKEKEEKKKKKKNT